eukprot:TRINITY_DN1122_c0_g2_i1.p1 TRINITY_DN1122_c0_g2~~TRINITY_DN1122_c0_g2_i1.p1  ORF type:complete len:118 (-),score=29.05 TRINITY_DN1122_c0_g2_i1:77-430(-)
MSYGAQRQPQKPRRRKHTIILVQITKSPTTRTYYDFETVTQAMSGVCQIYEDKLKKTNPGRMDLEYNVQHLFDFVDQLGDMGALVFEESIGAYVPYARDWIKQRVLKHLKEMAGQRR